MNNSEGSDGYSESVVKLDDAGLIQKAEKLVDAMEISFNAKDLLPVIIKIRKLDLLFQDNNCPSKISQTKNEIQKLIEEELGVRIDKELFKSVGGLEVYVVRAENSLAADSRNDAIAGTLNALMKYNCLKQHIPTLSNYTDSLIERLNVLLRELKLV